MGSTYYRRHGLVGPVILVGLGAILLLENMGLLSGNLWTVLLRMWPLILIAIGIDLLIGRRSTWGALLSLILIVALFVGGFLTCLGLALSLLALNGTIRPAPGGGAAAVASTGAAASSAAASPGSAGSGPVARSAASPGSAPTVAPLVTPPPIVAPTALTPTDLASGYTLGGPDAKVTVEAWEDYQCPYCHQFTEAVEPQVVKDYVETGKVRLTFRNFAFLGDESAWAAVAADLAKAQGKFWPYHDYLYANQLGENVGSFSVARLQMIADAVGLDRTAFDAGMQLDAARARYAQLKQLSDPEATKLGITATPTIVVDGKKLPGNDWASIRAAIDAALVAKK